MITNSEFQALLKNIGDRIRTRRKALALTQEKLAELAGLSSTFVAKLETGVKTPSLDTLVQLAEVLNVDAADLIRKVEATSDMSRARTISDALAGLSEDDIEFVIEELLRISSHLRQSNK